MQLGGVRVENFHDEETTVEIRIDEDEKTVQQTTITTSAASDSPSTQILDCEWDTEAEHEYSVGARTDESAEWSDVVLGNDASDTDCQWIGVQLEADAPYLVERDCANYPETPCEKAQ